MGPHPTERGTARRAPGTTRQLAVDRQGRPLSAGLTGAARPDAPVVAAVVARIPPVRGSRGRPRQRPEQVHADTGDAARHCRRSLHRRGITVRLARKGVEDTARLGRWRRVVGRTFARSNHDRRLALRYERRAALHQALLDRACALIGLKALRRHTTALGNG